MDLPSSRELELEALLRKKESQLAELTVRFLTQYYLLCVLNSAPGAIARMKSTPYANISRPNPMSHSQSRYLCRPPSYLYF